MKIRIVTSIVALLLFAIILITPEYVFAIGFFIVSIVALKEFHNAIDKKGNKPFTFLNFIASGFILISMALYLKDISKNTFYEAIVIFIFSLSVIYTGFGIIRHSKYTLTDIIINYFSIIYIVIPITSLVFIRNYEYGIYNMMYIFIGAWITDTFAYFTGRLLGKRKLIKSLSPKKTIAGSVGGTIGCVVFVVAYGAYLNYNIYVTEISYLYIIILGLVLGGVSQLGDLFASYIKREAGIKDFGKIMPGHGGILDRFDSILMTIPVVTIFVLLLF